MLQVKNLNLVLGHQHILHDINLTIDSSGELIGIMGPNGAGKSSFIKSILGEFKSTGEALWYGIPIKNQLSNITYIPQRNQLDLDFPITVKDALVTGYYQTSGWFKPMNKQVLFKRNQLLSDLQLTDLKDKTLNQLSGGQLQRVLLAKALMKDSFFLCLDEPFVGIDFKSEEIMIQLLKQLKSEGKLILIVHHDIHKAEAYFDRIILLNRTLKYFGPSSEALTDDKIKEVFLKDGGTP
nr:metal ABC transporter ATP-binding protein [Mammaliicoccus sp. Marseille-Q6498]